MNEEFKRRIYEVLEVAHPDDRLSRVVDRSLIALIVLNVAAAIIETVEPIHIRYQAQFWAFEVFSVAIFSVEYILRIWICDKHLSLMHHGPLKARLKFAVTPYALIDLAAILPFYLALFMPFADLRLLRIFRLLRLLKLLRYSPALASLARVFKNERRALVGSLLIVMALLLISSTVIYYIERDVSPEAFGSIPQSMWWALATLTTVGYGDVVPLTPLGKMIGGLVMILGVGIFALPIGILASGFSTEIQRRDFVVSWGMIARVPLFARLDGASMSRILNLLQARVVEADTVIFHQGDPAAEMYFIATGEVLVELEPKPVSLGEGDFFGELALLNDAPRRATVRTVTQCRLLALDYDDFRALLASNPEMRDHINEVVERREAERVPPDS
jgi:voltage-gated potassium channel